MPDPTLRGQREQIVLTGDVPSPANPPSGCRFHTRCWKAQDICRTETPELIDRPDGAAGHRSACHFAEVRQIVETVDLSNEPPTGTMQRIEAAAAHLDQPGTGGTAGTTGLARGTGSHTLD